MSELTADQIAERLFEGIPYITLYTTESRDGEDLFSWLLTQTTARLDNGCFTAQNLLARNEQAMAVCGGLFPLFITCVRDGRVLPGRLNPYEFVTFLQRAPDELDSVFQTFFSDVPGDEFLAHLMKSRYSNRERVYRPDPVQPMVVTSALPNQGIVMVRVGLQSLPRTVTASA